MSDLILVLQDTPVPTILVVAGIIFLFLAVVGRFAWQITITTKQKILSGLFGALFLLSGIYLYAAPGAANVTTLPPASPPTPTSTNSPTSTPTPTITLTPTNTNPPVITPTITPTPDEVITVPSSIDYRLRVEDSSTRIGLQDAAVSIKINGQETLDGVTNSDGIVTIAINSQHSGQAGELFINMDGYESYNQVVDLVESDLPNIVQLKAASPPAPAPPPSISGKLAIPVILGNEYKVYVTEFDGQGINGSQPISIGNARQPMFRRDGQAILVNGTGANFITLFVTDIKGQNAKLVNNRGEAHWPSWSPDGTEIIFADFSLNKILIRQSSEGAFDAPDFTEVRVNNISIGVKKVIWSDDNQLVFQACSDWSGDSGTCGIWITNPDSVAPKRIVVSDALPMDAKNGLLAYVSAQDSDWDIYVVPLSGGNARNITNNEHIQDGLPVISPDGRSIAYISNETGQWALWTVTLSNLQKEFRFNIDPQRGDFDVNTWAEERMSWAR